MEAMIVASGLEKRFSPTGDAAITELSTQIQPGEITGLVGPDGAGKTTLMRMFAGLLAPTAGSLRVVGLDPVHQSEALHLLVGYMPQKFGLYEDLTVM